jgi:hypothetical protein
MFQPSIDTRAKRFSLPSRSALATSGFAESNVAFSSDSSFPFLWPHFFIGVLSCLSLQILGKIYIGELLALIYLLFSSRQRNEVQLPMALIVLGGAWVFSQILSDFVNHVTVADSLKGIGAPALMATTLVALFRYFSLNPLRLPSFLLGTTVGFLLDLYISPTPYFLYNPWKWGLGVSLLGAGVIFFSFFLKTLISAKWSNASFLIFAVVYGLIGFANDSRGGLIPLLAFTAFLLFQHRGFLEWFNNLFGNGRRGFLRAILFLIAFVLSLNFLLTWVFITPVVMSMLPSALVEKNLKQSSNTYGILLGGRMEIFSASRAFLDKPLLGHGSWPKDPSFKYKVYALQQLQASGSGINSSDFDTPDFKQNDLIPVHSHLFQGFVWSGLFGGLFWLYVLYLLVNTFLANFQGMRFFFFLGLVQFTWNILFSPFGYSARFESALFLGAILSYYRLTGTGNLGVAVETMGFSFGRQTAGVQSR